MKSKLLAKVGVFKISFLQYM